MTGYDYERGYSLAPLDPDSRVMCKVRGYGYAEVHLAAIPVAQLRVLCDEEGCAFEFGAASPIAGICGTRVRSAHPFVKVGSFDERFYARPGRQDYGLHDVTCQHCARRLPGWLSERQRAGAKAIDFNELFR